MAIDINRVQGTPTTSVKGANAGKPDAQVQQNSQGSQAPASQPAAAHVKDSVSLTQQAQSLGNMQRAMASTPSFSQERVASIKKAIAEGQYKVDPEKLAQKLQDFEKELGNLAGS
ncbi:flagellar biosynthesis anti-sigma factor FlgM [Neiella marina]|uniref:Negative regulator of flagellin synthesis n=1 Tax=Neiella holothuriorum TaxID=2870530 RepID=A0ABS7EET6_9GAMM|nr:flagellar biosynthesis anti-sigma factor FlgM [Neiella holothuriorum]MBW8190848.1 flagellar biosynthesis anti-sigma factor FlgM [Neiella holothuriorum]